MGQSGKGAPVRHRVLSLLTTETVKNLEAAKWVLNLPWKVFPVWASSEGNWRIPKHSYSRQNSRLHEAIARSSLWKIQAHFQNAPCAVLKESGHHGPNSSLPSFSCSCMLCAWHCARSQGPTVVRTSQALPSLPYGLTQGTDIRLFPKMEEK